MASPSVVITAAASSPSRFSHRPHRHQHRHSPVTAYDSPSHNRTTGASQVHATGLPTATKQRRSRAQRRTTVPPRSKPRTNPDSPASTPSSQRPWDPEALEVQDFRFAESNPFGLKRKVGGSTANRQADKKVSFNAELEVLGGSSKELDRIVEANMKVSKVSVQGWSILLFIQTPVK